MNAPDLIHTTNDIRTRRERVAVALTAIARGMETRSRTRARSFWPAMSSTQRPAPGGREGLIRKSQQREGPLRTPFQFVCPQGAQRHFLGT
jgi:hypothetical protein